jgi:hypothetical protein
MGGALLNLPDYRERRGRSPFGGGRTRPSLSGRLDLDRHHFDQIRKRPASYALTFFRAARVGSMTIFQWSSSLTRLTGWSAMELRTRRR